MSIEIVRPESINSTLVGFVSDPDGRGTLSLLFSCLLTLGLCVWSAVHLNLPKYDESENAYSYRYFKWSILGLFGPELVIWAAWRQFISARALTKSINEVIAIYPKNKILALTINRIATPILPRRRRSHGQWYTASMQAWEVLFST